VGIKISDGISEHSMEIPQKIKKMELPCNPTIPLLGIYPK
jgi:hypothetical protein